LTRKTVNGAICLPISLVKKVDIVKGDITRSRFVRRAIEKYLRDRSMENTKDTEVMGATIEPETPITQECPRKTMHLGMEQCAFSGEHHGR
jgi:metal-responsive CopG/Arc/MetJ family transcriptional regulator